MDEDAATLENFRPPQFRLRCAKGAGSAEDLVKIDADLTAADLVKIDADLTAAGWQCLRLLRAEKLVELEAKRREEAVRAGQIGVAPHLGAVAAPLPRKTEFRFRSVIDVDTRAGALRDNTALSDMMYGSEFDL